jgi:hypothetical protein
MLRLLRLGRDQCRKVSVVPIVRDRDQPLVKAPLVLPRLVAPDQQDGLALGIESKGDPPDLADPGKPELLHVGVPRSLEVVDRWPPQVGAELGEELRVRQQLIL